MLTINRFIITYLFSYLLNQIRKKVTDLYIIQTAHKLQWYITHMSTIQIEKLICST